MSIDVASNNTDFWQLVDCHSEGASPVMVRRLLFEMCYPRE